MLTLFTMGVPSVSLESLPYMGLLEQRDTECL